MRLPKATVSKDVSLIEAFLSLILHYQLNCCWHVSFFGILPHCMGCFFEWENEAASTSHYRCLITLRFLMSNHIRLPRVTKYGGMGGTPIHYPYDHCTPVGDLSPHQGTLSPPHQAIDPPDLELAIFLHKDGKTQIFRVPYLFCSLWLWLRQWEESKKESSVQQIKTIKLKWFICNKYTWYCVYWGSSVLSYLFAPVNYHIMRKWLVRKPSDVCSLSQLGSSLETV